jgi:hypothetical protein
MSDAGAAQPDFGAGLRTSESTNRGNRDPFLPPDASIAARASGY